MRLWPFSRRTQPLPDAEAAEKQAHRASVDADRLACRVDEVAEKLHRTHSNNHFRLAVEQSIRRA